jgi:hypothetical protein
VGFCGRRDCLAEDRLSQQQNAGEKKEEGGEPEDYVR